MSRKLAEHRTRLDIEARASRKAGSSQGIAEGLKLASEFAAGIIVGAAIGYFIDRAAGTTPFGLIFFLMIGFAAGVRNILRAVSPETKPVAKPPQIGPNDGKR
nr:AtpZ/AtpI family protein [Jiella flava]